MKPIVKTLCLMVLGSLPLTLASSVGVVALSGCPSEEGGGTGGGGNKGGGSGGGGGDQPAFTLFTLDANARETVYYAMAVDPVAERVGVAYFTPNGTSEGVDGGGGQTPNYDLQYVEWNKGTIAAPEKLRVVQRMVGLSLAFDPKSHEPVVAFLGGDPGFMVGKSIFWFQSDAAVMRRVGGTWTEVQIAVDSAPPPCSPIDVGFLPGLWSSLVFDSTGKMYVSFRDGHSGEFQQDWASSDVELMEGGGEKSLTRRCLTGDHKQAYGGRIQLAIGADDQPAVVYDSAFGGAATSGQNVFFQRRNATDGTWTPTKPLVTVSNTMSGASLAYDGTPTGDGYGVAYTDLGTNQLSYLHSKTGDTWTVPDSVFGTGTGGWNPSLAMDPVNHEPAIAFYTCSPRSGVPESSCLQGEDDLRVTQRIGGNWRETVVDVGGGWSPKLAFFASGKRVVAYRTPSSLDSTAKVNPTAGVLMLAVEK